MWNNPAFWNIVKHKIVEDGSGGRGRQTNLENLPLATVHVLSCFVKFMCVITKEGVILNWETYAILGD